MFGVKGAGNKENGSPDKFPHLPASSKWKLPRFRWPLIAVLALVFLAAGFWLGQAAGANPGSAPGSEGDPLVTVSWVEDRLERLSRALREEQAEFLNEVRRQLEEGDWEPPAEPPPEEREPEAVPDLAYRIVEVPRGRKLYTGAGTEFILRNGRASSMEGPGGGIADVTAGRDLTEGVSISRNHLLLSAREDGRGAVTETDTIFLVRGDYQVE